MKRTAPGRKYYIQATTWRDKKQVCFLSTNGVGSTNGLTVKHHVKGKRKLVELDAPKAQHDYVEKYNTVDKNDRDTADYSTTIHTIWYYLRIV